MSSNILAMQKISILIKDGRIKKSLLQRQVAAALDIDVAMLSRFERGERLPSKEQLKKIATILNLDEKELLKELAVAKIINDIKNEDNPSAILKAVQKEIKKEST